MANFTSGAEPLPSDYVLCVCSYGGSEYSGHVVQALAAVPISSKVPISTTTSLPKLSLVRDPDPVSFICKISPGTGGTAPLVLHAFPAACTTSLEPSTFAAHLSQKGGLLQ